MPPPSILWPVEQWSIQSRRKMRQFFIGANDTAHNVSKSHYEYEETERGTTAVNLKRIFNNEE